MKLKVVIILILSIAICIPVAAQSSGLYLEGGTSFLLGSTKYHTDFLVYDTSINDYVKGESELEYPFTFFLYNFKLGYNSENFGLFIKGAKNIHKPLASMKDSDWIGVPSLGIPQQKFSYTESDARGNYYQAETQLFFKLAQLKKASLKLLIGYKFEYLDYAMYGVEGWQNISSFVMFSGYENEKVLEYYVYYHIPYIGLELSLKEDERQNINVKLGISPYVMANDRDDHVLRKKWAKTKTIGWGAFLEGDLKIWASKTSLFQGWYFQGNMNISYMRTSGDQEQYFYGDDPGTAADETGTHTSGIHTVISQFQVELGVNLGFRF